MPSPLPGIFIGRPHALSNSILKLRQAVSPATVPGSVVLCNSPRRSDHLRACDTGWLDPCNGGPCEYFAIVMSSSPPQYPRHVIYRTKRSCPHVPLHSRERRTGRNLCDTTQFSVRPHHHLCRMPDRLAGSGGSGPGGQDSQPTTHRTPIRSVPVGRQSSRGTCPQS